MKRIFLFAAMLATMFVGCKKNEIEPAKPLFTNADVEFDYMSTKNPFELLCHNLSKEGLTATYWEMGDGKAYINGDRIKHTYAKAGTYTITLTCKDKNGYSYNKSKSVKFNNNGAIGDDDSGTTDPEVQQHVFLKSIEFVDLQEQDSYYKLTCAFKAKTGSDYTLNTGEMHIKYSDLPYTYTLATPKDLGTKEEFLSKYKEVSTTLKCAYVGQYKDILSSTLKIEEYKNYYMFYNSDMSIFFTINMEIK